LHLCCGIVEILELVDFRITKSELGAFRDENMKITWNVDQVLRNFLNGLVIIAWNQRKSKKINDVANTKHIPAKTV
jgi:uncharacterized protein YehS (DUF1456 family)